MCSRNCFPLMAQQKLLPEGLENHGQGARSSELKLSPIREQLMS